MEWLFNVVQDWRWNVTAAGMAGIMPSAQCVEAFNRILKVIAIRLNVKLNVFMFETVPELLRLAAMQNTSHVVHSRAPVGLQFMVSLCYPCVVRLESYPHIAPPFMIAAHFAAPRGAQHGRRR